MTTVINNDMCQRDSNVAICVSLDNMEMKNRQNVERQGIIKCLDVCSTRVDFCRLHEMSSILASSLK